MLGLAEPLWRDRRVGRALQVREQIGIQQWLTMLQNPVGHGSGRRRIANPNEIVALLLFDEDRVGDDMRIGFADQEIEDWCAGYVMQRLIHHLQNLLEIESGADQPPDPANRIELADLALALG